MSLLRGRARSRASTPAVSSADSGLPLDQHQQPTLLSAPASVNSMTKLLKRISLSVRPSSHNLHSIERPLPELPYSQHVQLQKDQQVHQHWQRNNIPSLNHVESAKLRKQQQHQPLQQHVPDFVVLPIAPASFERRRAPSVTKREPHSSSAPDASSSPIRHINATEGIMWRDRERRRSSSSLSSSALRSRGSSEGALSRRHRERAGVQVYGWTEEETAHANQMYVEFIEEKRKEAAVSSSSSSSSCTTLL